MGATGSKRASPRRIGAVTSRTRALLLDSTEQIMLEMGYAAVTYRSVAARAGVTAGLVQYYFPTLDDLFISLLELRTERHLQTLAEAFDRGEPLRVVWDYTGDKTAAALTLEFTALANHRKAIQAEIAKVGERVRQVQLDALTARWKAYGMAQEDFPPAALLFITTAVQRLILMEEAFGMWTGHAESRFLVERYLDLIDPCRIKTTSDAPGQGAK